MRDNLLEDSIFPIISHIVHRRVRCSFEYCPLLLASLFVALSEREARKWP